MPLDGISTISFPRNVDGIDSLICDDAIIEDDVLIKGDLVVLGSITGGGGPPVTFSALTVQNNYNGPTEIYTINTSSSIGSYTIHSFQNDIGTSVLFLNSSIRSIEGGANTFTIRNNVGQLRLIGNGGGQLNLSTNVNTPSILQITNTTQSTTPSTGALQVIGGVGIQGNLFVGGSINGAFNFTTTPTFTVSNLTGETFSVLSTTDTTSPITGSAKFSGGVGILKDLQVGEGVISKNITEVNNFDGSTFMGVTNTNTGTNARSGLSLTNNDGVGEVFLNSSNKTSDGGVNTLSLKNNVGNVRIISSGSASLILNTQVTSPSQILFSNATASTSTTTGALVVTGGVGVGGSIRCGAPINGTQMNASSNTNGETLISVSNNSTGTSAFTNLRLSNSAGNCSLFLNSTTRATEGGGSAATLRNDVGLLRLLGQGSNGITISATSGDCLFNSTTQSTSATTGAINTSGGVGITRDLFVGGNATITGTLTAGVATTFTPTFVTGAGITYTNQQGHHYRLGRLAVITINITTTSAIDLSATNLRVNMPFTNNNPGRILGSVLFDNFALPISSDTISAIVEPATNICTFLCTRDSLGWSLVTSPTTGGSRSISISITLFV